MPRRDRVHDAARSALVADGWTITADPLLVAVGRHNLYVDLAAERLLAAERGEERIAVEIKGFSGRSEVADLEQALGQFVLYRGLLARSDPGRRLVLAVPRPVWESLFDSELGRAAREDSALAVMVFDAARAEVWRWFL
ncbi:MAG: XisH family protein [Deltaproteobacteria bacterium]|nr:XisH family protein [Deltaproteobacteria bacterium]